MNRLLCALILASLAACHASPAPSEPQPQPAAPPSPPAAQPDLPSERIASPAIRGTVRGTPKKGMPNPKVRESPSQTPPLLMGETVVLRAYVAEDAPAGPVVARATTDEQGRFQITALPGTYFVCVVESDEEWAIVKGGKNFSGQDRVNDFKVVTIADGNIVEVELLVSQAWPV